MDVYDPDPRPGDTQTQERPPPPVWPADPAPSSGPQRGGPRRAGLAVSALVGALVAVLVTVPLTLWLEPDPPPLQLEAETSPVAAVAEAVLPAVARVDVLNPQGSPVGSGSAVIFRSDGHLLTNAHVIENAAGILVTLPDGSSHEPELVGVDPLTDLAVLRIAVDRPLPVPAFADDLPRIGETAIAIGSPFGLEGTVTSGVVSALNRTVPAEFPRVPLVDAIQTDAPINPGNSGGALVNANAEVIGINTAIFAGAGGAGNIGIGFAIPITTALTVAEQLSGQGFVEHAQLGVAGEPLRPDVAERYGLPIRSGAIVMEVVPGSSAEAAGIQRGDIIVSLDDEQVTSMSDLTALILRRSPGDVVEVEVFRADGTMRLEATLGARRPPE